MIHTLIWIKMKHLSVNHCVRDDVQPLNVTPCMNMQVQKFTLITKNHYL
jgi:hypothetical protein